MSLPPPASACVGNDAQVSNTNTPATTSVSCSQDNADRLASSAVINALSAESPLLAGNLMSTNLTHDSRGDVTDLADQRMTYDTAGREMFTATPSSGTGGPTNTITYARDVTGEVVPMSTPVGHSVVVKISFGGIRTDDANVSREEPVRAMLALRRSVTVTSVAAVCCLSLMLTLGGCATSPDGTGALRQLAASRSVSKMAKPVCRDIDAAWPLLAAGDSTLGRLRSMNLSAKYKARLGDLKGPYAGDSVYAAICIYSTNNIEGFSPHGQYMAWWGEPDGSDGILAVW